MPFQFVPAPSVAPIYEFAEATLVSPRSIPNPFSAVEVTGELNGKAITGFCDSQTGGVYRIRFMPTSPGEHRYTASIRHGSEEARFEGAFTAVAGPLKGLLTADGWGFRWSGTGEPFFWNSTTAYLMAGLSEDRILYGLNRLAQFGVNRIRVSLCPSRQVDGSRWYEPQVQHREDFTFNYSPWLCRQPDSQEDPQPDVTRFDVAYWQKFERLLAYARTLGIVVQVIFYLDAQETYNYPFHRPAPKPLGAADFDHTTCAVDADERRYFAYAAARFSAYSNVEWCITNEWAHFQSNHWVDEMGRFLQSQDPYGHLCSVHGHGHFPFRSSAWCTHALYQSWDENGSYDFLMRQRAEQEATGRILPQINEEYGYEYHYPGPWGGGKTPPARSAASRLRLAWEMAMAGCGQTTGESASGGLGGWINGLGEQSELLKGHKEMRRFFEAIPAWESLQPTARFVLENDTHIVRYDRDAGVATVAQK